jgi:hypothetical protein
MKLIIGCTALALMLSGASLYAQEPDKDKPKEEPKKEEAKPAPKPKQEEPKPAERPKETPKPAEKPKETPKPKPEEHPANAPARPATQERTVQQNNARTEQHNNGGAHRQPDEKFRTQIGREHHFRVTRSSDRRVSYGGYYFTYSEAWPGDWSYDDDVYIDYLDGQYYLIDLRHPGARLLLVVAD